tara:strand:- start:928 stop:1104 length:177 start_codon:yes stop_codon:yes gene_type:complete
MKDEIQERITHYENKFYALVNEIEEDTLLKDWAEGFHTEAILIMMKKQINLWLKETIH